MQEVRLPLVGTTAAWRNAARNLAQRDVPPEDVRWTTEGAEATLFDERSVPSENPAASAKLTVPRGFVTLADSAVCHSDPERFARLYALLLRVARDARILEDPSDPEVSRLRGMEKAVHRDMHKMTAFVRFREVPSEGPRRRFVSWFEPDHHIVEATSGFFARRFGDMDWLIATPSLCARFEDGEVGFLPGVVKPEGVGDPAELLWQTYFRNIFNPARLKVKAMQSEMPKKYWRNLPEAELIPELIAGAERRTQEMRARAATAPPARAERISEGFRTMMNDRPEDMGPLGDLRREAAVCTRCPLYANATQVVFGEGQETARLMFVGEQPGDQEDLAGRPFVGPAGQMFNAVLERAGIARDTVYVTNAVKHFKFNLRGKRRIHEKPNAGEVAACKWWLDAERARIQPKLVVALGATAALALTGDGKNILKRRGAVERMADGTPVFLTIHPSYLLRLPDPELKAREIDAFGRDLAAAAAHLEELVSS